MTVRTVPEVHGESWWPVEMRVLCSDLQDGYSGDYGVHKGHFMEGYALTQQQMEFYLRRLRPLFQQQGFEIVLDDHAELRLRRARLAEEANG